ncbi:HEPN domain-containing protein [Macrococcus brunensis]|uniref:HEPN domain-containing protein n=1 Tax=Macrococcus brunensis TaxID=198483 RepID=UPI003132CF58
MIDFIDKNIDNQSYFIDRVKFVEESVSFRTRLKQSFNKLPLKYQQELSDYVNKKFGYNRAINRNIRTLSNKLVDDRNNFIHNNIIQESKIYNLEDNLFEEATMLQKFLRYLILRELGIPEDLLLKDNYMYP